MFFKKEVIPLSILDLLKNYNVLGVDLGFTQSKGFTVKTDGTPWRFIMPSVVKFRTGEELDIGMKTNDGYKIDLLGHTKSHGKWFVGQSGDLDLTPKRFGEINHDWDYAKYFTVLGNYVHATGNRTIDKLITGLPVTEIKPYTEHLKRSMTGTFKFEFDGTPLKVEVKDVVVLPQPAGSFFGHSLTLEGKQNKKSDHVRGYVLILDIGGRTSDIIIMNNGIYEGGYSFDLAVTNVHDELSNLLLQTYDFSNLSPVQIDQALRTRSFSGIKIDTLVKQAVQSVFSKMTQEFPKNSLTRDFLRFDAVMVTGGGAPVFYPHLKSFTEKASRGLKEIPVIELPDAEFANATGFYKFAIFNLRKQLKTASAQQ